MLTVQEMFNACVIVESFIKGIHDATCAFIVLLDCRERNLRRRNTRYKNPQLVTQHCFVASFWRCFPFFTLLDQLDLQQKHLLRVEEMRRVYWLIFRTRANLLRDKLWDDEKRATKPKFVAQSRPALYFSQQLSSTRKKCFCCVTSWSRKVKNGKHRQKLATKQCCAISWTSWGFLCLVFRRLLCSLVKVTEYLSDILIQLNCIVISETNRSF